MKNVCYIASDPENKPKPKEDKMAFKDSDVSDYMRQIERYPLITVEREAELARLVHGDDPIAAQAARDELICANLRLVVKIAHTFKRGELPLDDLIAEGNCGLMRAAVKFDPSKGAKFSGYAAWWIKQAMMHALLHKTQLIRMPEGRMAKLIRIRKAIRQLEESGTAQADVSDIAAESGIPDSVVRELLSNPCSCVSMDEPMGDSGKTYEELISDSIEDCGSVSLAESEELEACTELAYREIGCLTELRRTILYLAYGLHRLKKEPIPVIAQEVGLPGPAVSSILEETVQALRGRVQRETA